MAARRDPIYGPVDEVQGPLTDGDAYAQQLQEFGPQQPQTGSDAFQTQLQQYQPQQYQPPIAAPQLYQTPAGLSTDGLGGAERDLALARQREQFAGQRAFGRKGIESKRGFQALGAARDDRATALGELNQQAVTDYRTAFDQFQADRPVAVAREGAIGQQATAQANVQGAQIGADAARDVAGIEAQTATDAQTALKVHEWNKVQSDAAVNLTKAQTQRDIIFAGIGNEADQALAGKVGTEIENQALDTAVDAQVRWERLKSAAALAGIRTGEITNAQRKSTNAATNELDMKSKSMEEFITKVSNATVRNNVSDVFTMYGVQPMSGGAQAAGQDGIAAGAGPQVTPKTEGKIGTFARKAATANRAFILEALDGAPVNPSDRRIQTQAEALKGQTRWGTRQSLGEMLDGIVFDTITELGNRGATNQSAKAAHASLLKKREAMLEEIAALSVSELNNKVTLAKRVSRMNNMIRDTPYTQQVFEEMYGDAEDQQAQEGQAVQAGQQVPLEKFIAQQG